jgi:SAM-dependent methyltransferase
MATSCLNAVLRTEIPDWLAGGPKPVIELAKAANVNADILYRILRALATTGVFTETAPHVFANTPASDVLRKDHPHSIRNLGLWMANWFHFDTYKDMLPTLRDGQTALEHIHHKPPFDAIFEHADVAKDFNDAMTDMSAMVIPAVLEAYDFSGIGTLGDIAGGHGFVLTAILQKYPQMQGILFDLDHVVKGAEPRIAQMGLTSRVRLAHGDFFEDVPAADAYVMKHIIHDWDDEKAATILRNCAKHLQPGGKVILLEAVIQPGNDPHFAKWIDVEMFMMPGGKERTEAEFRELFAKAGLRLTRVVPTKSLLCVVESERA